VTRRPPWEALLLAAALAVPAFGSRFYTFLANDVLIWALFATSLNLLVGYTGLVSFGHAAYFGIGAYTTGLLMKKLGVPFLLAFPAAGVLAGAFALLKGQALALLFAVFIGYAALQMFRDRKPRPSRQLPGAAVQAAFVKAREHSGYVVVESYIQGFDHRMLVVGGELVAVAKRVPGHVVGDGTRSIRELVSGIELPDLTIQDLRAKLKAALPSQEVVFCCEKAPAAGAIALRCLAMLPPAFIEYALRNGAQRVRAVGCEGECAYRLGMELAEERFAGRREPHLRATVRAERREHEYSFSLR